MNRLPLGLRRITLALFSLLSLFGLSMLGGCAHPPPPSASPAYLLNDHLFPAHANAIDRQQVFALNAAMLQYAETALRNGRWGHDPRRALIDALYSRQQLRLSYDAGSTRNAAEAFEARAGNCLSLVIMTAAFARHLDLPVSFRQVLVDETYTRSAGLMLVNGHVNLVLERLPARARHASSDNDDLIVDFLPAADVRGQRSLPLEEHTIVAMYFNNRAAEALAQGDMAQSYAFARAAVLEDPGYASAVNTLAVVYLRGGHLAQAEAALRHAVRADAESAAALSNLKIVLQRLGRHAEADGVAARLVQLQPHPPFHFFELGRQAMGRGDFETARQQFARELRRQPHQHEVHFWAAQAHWQLGNRRDAAAHLQLAMENSNTPDNQRLYAAKLDSLKGRRATRVQ
ncbi:MAG TPA: tetratricopeptide repeat protein [Rubrivivax sp.]|nr:tetratricopeptide repeat protein [Rubrivivax sp.]